MGKMLYHDDWYTYTVHTGATLDIGIHDDYISPETVRPARNIYSPHQPYNHWLLGL